MPLRYVERLHGRRAATDCDGAVDYPGCLSRVERFWNTDICSHQYKADRTTPDGGYVYEPGEHFYVYRTSVPGTVPLYQLSDGPRHLVTLDPSEGIPIAIASPSRRVRSSP